ncbi:hypothetical protein BU17DRAFT_72419 [Hysterangium stoloniferum]|nr:hypothetical protein BU17DRAFT_72419 [Hysterangium stoloniferum]
MYSKYLRIVLVGMLFCCFWVGFYPQIVRDARYLASLNDPVQHKADSELLINSLANDASALEKAEQFYFDTTQALIKQKSFTLSGSAGYSGEVLNLIPVHFAATAIAGLPLKTETTPRGIYMEHELQQMLRDVFAYIFFEVEAAKKMRAEHFAGLHTQELLGYIKTNVKNIRQTGPYDVMLSGTPRIVFIPLDVGHQTKLLQSHSSLTMKPILELTPCLNTSWPVFPFMHDCIYLIFTPGAQSHCSLTSYGPGAPPLSLQGPYDVMLSGHFGIYSPPQH